MHRLLEVEDGLWASVNKRKIYPKVTPVSYALSIISIARKTLVDNIISQCYISVDQKRNPRNDGLSDCI